MASIGSWIKAARLRTLPLSVSGIIVGASIGNFEHQYQETLGSCFDCKPVWMSGLFWLAICTTIGFQIVSNFANDYGDGVKGTDANRVGEQRMIASGSIKPKAMKKAIIITAVVSFILALLTIFTAFGKDELLNSLLFIGLGIASLVAAITYTVGKKAYGYFGFGDVFVFVFFGLLSVLGSFFLFTHFINHDLLLPATSIGLLSTAVLNLNNLRDIENDKLSGKNTLVVYLGFEKAKKYHYFLLITAMACAIVYSLLYLRSFVQFSYVIAFIPLILNIITVAKTKDPKALDGELKKVALSTFVFAILFSTFH